MEGSTAQQDWLQPGNLPSMLVSGHLFSSSQNPPSNDGNESIHLLGVIILLRNGFVNGEHRSKLVRTRGVLSLDEDSRTYQVILNISEVFELFPEFLHIVQYD